MKPRLFAVSPYREGAFSAIVREASHSGVLDTLLMPNRSFRSGAILRPGADGNRTRLVHAAIDLASTSLELSRALTRKSQVHVVQKRWMYSVADIYDILGSKLLHARPLCILGLPGACLNMFAKASPDIHTRIFHAVNAHPIFHNQILIDTYGINKVGNELVPKWVLEKQLQELEIADLILAPSSTVARQMRDAGVNNDKLIQIPYGVDSNFFRPSQKHQDYPRSGGPPRILFVGQISFRKGLPFLVQAARRIRADVDLVGPIVSRSVLKSLPANVHYLGVRSKEEIRSLMFRTDAFVLPSVEDACALVTTEAAAAGLPIITTRSNGAVDLLAHNPSHRILDQLTTNELTNALDSIQPLNPSDRQKNAHIATMMGNSSIKDWQSYAQSVLASIIHCGSGPTMNNRGVLGKTAVSPNPSTSHKHWRASERPDDHSGRLHL